METLKLKKYKLIVNRFLIKHFVLVPRQVPGGRGASLHGGGGGGGGEVGAEPGDIGDCHEEQAGGGG